MATQFPFPCPLPPACPLIIAENLALLRGALAGAMASWSHGPLRTAADGPELHAALLAEPTALVLLDLALAPGGIRPIRTRHPRARILALGAGTDPNEPRRCLNEGAVGHIARTASLGALTRALTRIRDGAAPPPAHPTARLGSPPRALHPPTPNLATLTGRQQDVVRLLAEGRSTKDIARALDLAVSTVKVHLAAVYRTFGARNRVEALCRAGCLPPMATSPAFPRYAAAELAAR